MSQAALNQPHEKYTPMAISPENSHEHDQAGRGSIEKAFSAGVEKTIMPPPKGDTVSTDQPLRPTAPGSSAARMRQVVTR